MTIVLTDVGSVLIIVTCLAHRALINAIIHRMLDCRLKCQRRWAVRANASPLQIDQSMTTGVNYHVFPHVFFYRKINASCPCANVYDNFCQFREWKRREKIPVKNSTQLPLQDNSLAAHLFLFFTLDPLLREILKYWCNNYKAILGLIHKWFLKKAWRVVSVVF